MDEILLLMDQCLLHARHVRNLSPKYLDSVKSSCRLFFAHSLVNTLSQCTGDAIEAWLLDGRANRGWAAATYRSRHRDV